ncbi:spore coat protein GerQ [Mesobacillus zeae]|uniref:Spore coat protein GerQ n=1 Tax=Mesobacillus zeae TaxID=1917180 RepID=A0A398B9R4_9BACI|nr:spore coat protein GerQ [Mesobacillus zeae]RID86849.1 spore coat protein GerQ [Mesobacillus zeae]
MTQQYYPYYDAYRAPQNYQQGTGAASQPQTGFQGSQMIYPYPQAGGAVPGTAGGGMQPGMQPGMQAGGTPGGGINVPGMLPAEESYIENILRLNKGKLATIYMTFENNREWNAKIFKGTIEAAGRDHIIIKDPQTGTRYLLLMVYLDYITFDEEIEYQYPFSGAGGQGLASYPPR